MPIPDAYYQTGDPYSAQRLNQPPPNYRSPFNQNKVSYLPGRVITNPDEVTPQEVPMDGSVALFLMKDYSAIYAKAWNNNGTITPVKYVPDPTAQQAMAGFNFQQEVINRLDQIERRLNTRKPNYKQRYSKPEQKEEKDNAI